MIAWAVALAGPIPNAPESAPYWIALLESYTPVFAAFIVTIVLARTGFSQKLNEYRKDTVEMIRLRSETLEKQLAEAQGEIGELQRENRRKDRRIEDLEIEIHDLRDHLGGDRIPRRRAPRRPPEGGGAAPPREGGGP